MKEIPENNSDIRKLIFKEISKLFCDKKNGV